MDELLATRFSSQEAAGPECPQFIGAAWGRLVRTSGVRDPLRDEKRRQNQAALALLPAARAVVGENPPSFRRAVELAIAGNSIDALAGDDLPGQLDSPWLAAQPDSSSSLATERVDEFERHARCSRSVVYLADNCGEAVFDRLLIEALRNVGVQTITYVTRGAPILNDITCPEACTVGLDEVASVIGNGVKQTVPGTDWDLLPQDMQALLSRADLIVSKGGGNYKLLSGRHRLSGRVFFLLQAKCQPLNCRLGVSTGELVIEKE